MQVFGVLSRYLSLGAEEVVNDLGRFAGSRCQYRCFLYMGRAIRRAMRPSSYLQKPNAQHEADTVIHPNKTRKELTMKPACNTTRLASLPLIYRLRLQLRQILALLLSFAFITLSGVAQAASKAEMQQETRSMAQDTLTRLYQATPSAKTAVERAAGYAVFSNFGMKILIAGGGTGKGVVVDNKSKKETFMKMVEAQAGLGFGVKKFKLIWVFENKSDLDKFVNSGWEIGAQSSITAKSGGKGTEVFAGALSVTPGVWLYQLSDDGLALELTAKGTKYYKDSDLN
jgi:lipid-binding SYLF domain-containing protein